MKPATQTERGVEVRAGYKRTEVGVIPEDWEVCPVRGKGEVLTGKALAVNALGPQRPYLRTKNVFDGRIDIDDVLTMPMTDEQFAQFQIRNGDVLLNEGQSLELVGRCAIYQDEYPEPCAIQNALLRFRAREDVSKKFASYLFRHCQQTGVFARIALQTTSVAHLGGSRFERLCLPWPTEPEQRAIAVALSDVDALLGGLDRLIAKKRDLKQAAMQQLLTGQTRLPGFSGEWEVKTLFDLAERKKELFDDGDWIESEHITTEGIRLIQTGNIGVGCFVEKETRKFIYEKSFTSLRCKQLKTGDLLVCRLADPAGRACVLPDIGEERIVTSVDVTIFRPPVGMADRVYLANVFSTPEWFRAVSDRSGGTTHKRISRGALGRISITLPPLPEQSAIAAVLSDMDAELSKLVERRDKTSNLKQAMMQELLTGRIRLV
jgi:type I restriction enzyme S subunit